MEIGEVASAAKGYAPAADVLHRVFGELSERLGYFLRTYLFAVQTD